jgi:putative ABC transport system permease protein
LIVLLGQSGSGKTTFLNIMGGLEKASAGEIEIGDQIIKSGSSQTWDAIRNQDIGYIFQNYHLIPTLTVYENIALSLRILGLKDEKEIERRVLYTLKAVKMHHFRARYINQLSGGQQQRIAIARAIVKNPQVILADEPTGNLDTRNTFEIMNIIKKISEEKLVILVTHEKNLVNHYADRIIEIKDGTILNDYLNEKKSHYAIDDHTIFLKDLKRDQDIHSAYWNIDAYHEDDEFKKPNEVTLIIRNETLYLNVGSYD